MNQTRNKNSLGRQVAQAVEHWTLEVEVQCSKPALGTWWWGRISINQPYLKDAAPERRPHHSMSGDSKFMGFETVNKKKKRNFGSTMLHSRFKPGTDLSNLKQQIDLSDPEMAPLSIPSCHHLQLYHLHLLLPCLCLASSSVSCDQTLHLVWLMLVSPDLDQLVT